MRYGGPRLPILPPGSLDRTMTYWHPIKDGDPRALALYERHYSARHYRDGRVRKRFVGPGQYIALLTANGDALWIWKTFCSLDCQRGVCCSMFRNESRILSSLLIRE